MKALRAILARLERFRCVRCGQVAFDRHLVRPGVFTCRDPFFYRGTPEILRFAQDDKP